MKPVILITCDAIEQPDVRYIQRAYYTDSVTKAGGLPFFIPPLHSSEDMLEALALADGVLLTGSPDLDPSLYGQERHERTKLMHRRREKFELEFTKLVYEKDIPVLAVCGGFQILSVVLGGTLIQHIPDSVEGALGHFTVDGEKASHKVEIDRGSMLFSITKKTSLHTNSFHHQSLDVVPPVLKVTAHAPDGVIEAYEDPQKKFCLGVQWHPERMVGCKEHESVFTALIEAARSQK